MGRFLFQRLIQAAIVLALMSVAVHGLIGLMPGDPVDLMIAADPRMTVADAQRLRALHGLDRPWLDRYGEWAAAALAGDLGISRLHGRPVAAVIAPALANTLVLLGAAFTLSVSIGLLAGVAAARRPGGRLDTTINLLSFAGISMPPFWLGILLIILFAVVLGVLPAGGMGADGAGGGWETVRHLALPVCSLTLASAGAHTRFARAALIEVLRQDYIRTARAKGLSERRVLFGHALRNALIPVVTVAALDFGAVVSGALVTETVFAYPGMGRLIYDAVMGNDYPLALAALLFATLVTLAANLLADVAYAALDPRLSFGGGRR